eukprot:8944952-Pyramimonas_sp.AAC.1
MSIETRSPAPASRTLDWPPPSAFQGIAPPGKSGTMTTCPSIPAGSSKARRQQSRAQPEYRVILDRGNEKSLAGKELGGSSDARGVHFQS